jgi:hypothetical protein
MLAPNDTCTIDVTFTPTVSGANSATLAIGGLAASLTGNGTRIFTVENSNLTSVYSLWGASATEVLATASNAITVSTGNGTWLNRNNGVPSGHVYVVGGSGTGDEHAVGLSSTAQPTSNHLVWDGTQWNSTLVTSTGTLMLSAVTSTSTSDAFAVGSDGGAHGALWHYDGTFWTEFSFPALKDAGLGGVNLVSVSAPAPGVAWTVGTGGTILTWNAGVFTDVSFSVNPAPPTYDLATVWAKSATEAWISGSNGLVIHISGNALDDQSLPTNAGSVRLSGRVVAGGVELWAVSSGSTYRSTGKNDWTPVTVPIVSPGTVWVQPNGDVYLGNGSGAIAHYY